MPARKKKFEFVNCYTVDPDNRLSLSRVISEEPSLVGCKKYMAHLKKVRAYSCLEDYYKLQVIKHPKMGFGVFASQRLKRGEVLCHYSGEICSARKANSYHLDNAYLFTLSGCGYPRFRMWLINALEMGNISRFINHSESNSNLRHEIKLLASEELKKPFPYIFFVADRDIEPGEQLFYDYGADYWKQMGIKPHED